mmetsp:Transcript_1390/g.3206  ORF Transcript_1390/g.3206 Transcript_1390/m.3206 type:complete len:295 (+) Transcript_1390:1580-2464(+)
MHNIFPVGGMLLNNQISFPIEPLQNLDRCVLPGFVYRLKSLNGWVGFVSLDDGFDDFKGVLDVFVVDRRILGLFLVEGSDPSCVTNGPVLKGLFGDVFTVERRRPLETHGLTRVVETVLAVLHGMNVQQDGQAVGVRPIQHCVDVFQSAVETPVDVGPVRLVHVIPNGDTEGVDPRLGQLFDNVFSHPGFPVAAELSVGFLGTQNLAKRISVHSDLALVGLPQKLVKEGRCDPRLEDHPSSEVDPTNLVIEGDCMLVFHAGHGFVHGDEVGILRPAFGDGSCRLESRSEDCSRE